MNIGIYAPDSKLMNLAILKISQYHKSKKDNVQWYMPLLSYDKVYISKIFKFTKLEDYKINNAIWGGSGYDVKKRLDDEIDRCQPDYSIYGGDSNYSIQFFSRGCIRNCSFCIVREKEGYIKPVEPMDLNPKGEWIEILDNNFFANPEWKNAIDYLLKVGQPVNFSQGIDARIVTEEQAHYLSKLKFGGGKFSTFTNKKEFGKLGVKQLHIAWDNPKENIDEGIKILTKYLKPYQISCYVLIGYNSTHEENYYRVMKLKEFGIKPYIMVYDKSDTYQRKFARWVNMRPIFDKVKWEDYKDAKEL